MIVEPFDLILFYGGDIPAKIICRAQKFHMKYMGYDIPKGFRPEWSHVGIAINTSWLDIENGEPNTMYVWESTYSGNIDTPRKRAKDVESKKGLLGVQIRKLDDVLKTYIQYSPADAIKDYIEQTVFHIDDSLSVSTQSTETSTKIKSRQRIAVLKMKPIFRKIIESERLILKPKIQRFHRENYHQGYDASISLLAAVIPYLRRFRNKKDKRLFCSELAGKVYQCLGLIDDHHEASNIIPSDFAYPEYSEEKVKIFEYPWIELHSISKDK